MANFQTGLRGMTASIQFANGEASLTYFYQVLWTGDDYEVTVMSEPSEDSTMEFIERANRGTLAHCVAFVKNALRRDVVQMAQDRVVFEEEI